MDHVQEGTRDRDRYRRPGGRGLENAYGLRRLSTMEPDDHPGKRRTPDRGEVEGALRARGQQGSYIPTSTDGGRSRSGVALVGMAEAPRFLRYRALLDHGGKAGWKDPSVAWN